MLQRRPPRGPPQNSFPRKYQLYRCPVHAQAANPNGCKPPSLGPPPPFHPPSLSCQVVRTPSPPSSRATTSSSSLWSRVRCAQEEVLDVDVTACALQEGRSGPLGGRRGPWRSPRPHAAPPPKGWTGGANCIYRAQPIPKHRSQLWLPESRLVIATPLPESLGDKRTGGSKGLSHDAPRALW